MRHRLTFLVLVVAISLLPQHVRAQWQPDGAPICTVDTLQIAPTAVPDGAGGAIVAWLDYRNGSSTDVYAQRVDALGVPLWTDNGVALCTAAGNQWTPTITSDGAAGAIVTWEDRRIGVSDIYAQRVNASGTPQWTPDGVALCTAVNGQGAPTIDLDGAGGAIVTWIDGRSGNYHIYAQRVNALGVPQWTADGVALCTAANDQYYPSIVLDGAGGAIVTWHDFRNGFPHNTDIYAQRVNASGTPQWTPDGVALCTAVNGQDGPMIVSDGAGGAIVTWTDGRSFANVHTDIYAQRVNTLGVLQWTANGVALCTAANQQESPAIVSDGSGGAIVTWYDVRSGAGIYAQRVSDLGTPQWTSDGVALCTIGNAQPLATIVPDDAGGAIVTWYDYRNGTADIFAQRVNALGILQWTVNGVALCTAAGTQQTPTIASDDAGGAIVTWGDGRSGTNNDIYAQHVTDPVNAVAIASFDASEVNGVVTLRSEFRSDLGVEAVNVYRAVGTDRDPLLVLERVNDIRGDRFEYVDRDVAPGQSYRYRIGVVDADGEFFSAVITVSVAAIKTELSQNQPNPFNPTTTIHFVLPTREQVTLAIYDTSGHLVRTLVNQTEDYGAHDVTWDGRDNDGAAMGSGVYFYRLHAGKHTESKKMVLLK